MYMYVYMYHDTEHKNMRIRIHHSLRQEKLRNAAWAP